MFISVVLFSYFIHITSAITWSVILLLLAILSPGVVITMCGRPYTVHPFRVTNFGGALSFILTDDVNLVGDRLITWMSLSEGVTIL